MAFGAKSTAKDVVAGHNLQGKVAVVTGGNSGIGVETVRALAAAGAKVYLCSRNVASGEAVAEEIRKPNVKGEVIVRHLDLADFNSIDAFVAAFLATGDELHYLILNAGVVMPMARTVQGLEMVMGVNHVAHFVLTLGLLQKMKEQGSEARIIAVSSLAHSWGTRSFDATDLNWEKRRYNTLAAYSESKLANILFAKELARRCEGSSVTAFSLHPGTIASTNLQRHTPGIIKGLVKAVFFVLGSKTTEQGAATTVYAAVEPSLATMPGAYLDNCKVVKAAPQAEDMALARKLWEATEALVEHARRPAPANEAPPNSTAAAAVLAADPPAAAAAPPSALDPPPAAADPARTSSGVLGGAAGVIAAVTAAAAASAAADAASQAAADEAEEAAAAADFPIVGLKGAGAAAPAETAPASAASTPAEPAPGAAVDTPFEAAPAPAVTKLAEGPPAPAVSALAEAPPAPAVDTLGEAAPALAVDTLAEAAPVPAPAVDALAEAAPVPAPAVDTLGEASPALAVDTLAEAAPVPAPAVDALAEAAPAPAEAAPPAVDTVAEAVAAPAVNAPPEAVPAGAPAAGTPAEPGSGAAADAPAATAAAAPTAD